MCAVKTEDGKADRHYIVPTGKTTLGSYILSGLSCLVQRWELYDEDFSNMPLRVEIRW